MAVDQRRLCGREESHDLREWRRDVMRESERGELVVLFENSLHRWSRFARFAGASSPDATRIQLLRGLWLSQGCGIHDHTFDSSGGAPYAFHSLYRTYAARRDKSTIPRLRGSETSLKGSTAAERTLGLRMKTNDKYLCTDFEVVSPTSSIIQELATYMYFKRQKAWRV